MSTQCTTSAAAAAATTTICRHKNSDIDDGTAAPHWHLSDIEPWRARARSCEGQQRGFGRAAALQKQEGGGGGGGGRAARRQ
jgi:hypothetical protein